MNRKSLHAVLGVLAALAMAQPASALVFSQRADAAMVPAAAGAQAKTAPATSQALDERFIIFEPTALDARRRMPASPYFGRGQRPTFSRLLKLGKSLRAEIIASHTDPALR